MDVQEHIRRLTAFRNTLPGFGLELAEQQAITGSSVRKNASIQEGINNDGTPGNKANYSDRKVPSYLLKGKELNQSGRNYLDNNLRANWYGLRQAQGLTSSTVNLTYSGSMWKNYGFLYLEIRENVYVAFVGISGPDVEVFEANEKRYGQFWKNTPEELANLHKDAENAIDMFVKRYF